MTSLSDEERVRTALRTLFPEADGPPLAPTHTTRPRHRGGTAASATLVLAGVVLGAVLIARSNASSHRAQITGTGDSPQASPSSTATESPPNWTGSCVPPNGRPANDFVGLTLSQSERLANERHLHIIVRGAAGRCLTQGSASITFGVDVNLDQLDANGVIPGSAHVLTAQFH